MYRKEGGFPIFRQAGGKDGDFRSLYLGGQKQNKTKLLEVENREERKK